VKTFTVIVQDAAHAERLEGVVSFVGEDESGSFGIEAGHVRFLTCLVIGLARLRLGSSGQWLYLAMPGAVAYFCDNVLTISTRRFVLDEDYNRINDVLQEQLLAEEEQLHAVKESLHRMEETMLQRLWEMHRQQA
jgi:F-type H+-transporting ATPase subunit epsilon